MILFAYNHSGIQVDFRYSWFIPEDWKWLDAERAHDSIILTQKMLNHRILSPGDKCSDQINNRP